MVVLKIFSNKYTTKGCWTLETCQYKYELHTKCQLLLYWNCQLAKALYPRARGQISNLHSTCFLIKKKKTTIEIVNWLKHYILEQRVKFWISTPHVRIMNITGKMHDCRNRFGVDIYNKHLIRTFSHYLLYSCPVKSSFFLPKWITKTKLVKPMFYKNISLGVNTVDWILHWIKQTVWGFPVAIFLIVGN